jgi:hypothetical protein
MLMLLKQFLQKISSKTNCRNLQSSFRIGNSSSQRSFAKSSSFNIFAIFTKYEKSRDENGQEKESGCFSHTRGAGPPLAAPPWCENTSELVSIPVSSFDFPSMYNFRLYNPPGVPEVCISFSRRVFVSSCFCQGLLLAFELQCLRPVHPRRTLLRISSIRTWGS